MSTAVYEDKHVILSGFCFDPTSHKSFKLQDIYLAAVRLSQRSVIDDSLNLQKKHPAVSTVSITNVTCDL